MRYKVLVGSSEVAIEITTSHRKAVSLALSVAGWVPNGEGTWTLKASGGRTLVEGGGQAVVVEEVNSRAERGEAGEVYRSPIPGRQTWNGWRMARLARYLPDAPRAPVGKAEQLSLVFTDGDGKQVGDVRYLRMRVGDFLDQIPEDLKLPEGALYGYAYYFRDLVGVRDLRARVGV